jgi:pectate lyase
MKIRLPVNLLTTALLSLWLVNGCADQATKNPASKASPEAMAAIDNASDAIEAAKTNNWIWVHTETFLEEAQKAADAGDNQTAITLADKARFEAEAAVTQYNYERDHPRGLR